MAITIEQASTIVENAIRELHLKQTPVGLYDPVRYLLASGGKRLRPSLVLLSADMFGGNPLDAVHAALSIEIFHNFTLVHDDIMDNALIRRNNPTINARWGNNTAILSGDSMCFLAYGELLKSKPEKLTELLMIFNSTALEVCEGQQLDMEYENNNQISIKDYLEMIRLKTSVMIGASLKIGSIIGNADESNAEHIYKLGVNLGLAFQLQDDLLDLYAELKDFGKEVGKDILYNKKTYLYLKAIEIADQDSVDTLKYWMSQDSSKPEEKIKTVKEIFEKNNLREITQNQIDQYIFEANSILENLNIESENKIEIAKLLKSIKTRNR